jgi:hypothetical protein
MSIDRAPLVQIARLEVVSRMMVSPGPGLGARPLLLATVIAKLLLEVPHRRTESLTLAVKLYCRYSWVFLRSFPWSRPASAQA